MASLSAGTAKIDITPPTMGLRLGGHAVNRRAVGVRDRLFARALAVSVDGGPPLVIASLDLVGLMRGYVEQIRDRVGELPRERVWVCTTHTHDSPDTIGFWGPMIAEVPLHTGRDENYLRLVVDRTAEAIGRAVANLQPARLTVGTFAAPTEGWTRNVRAPGRKDDTVYAMRLTTPGGEGIGVLYHYACHPEFLGHTNRWISAEWPGVTGALLERRLGGVALLVQGSLGGMVTGAVSRDDGAFDPVVGQPFVPRLGRWVADAVLQAIETGESCAVDALRVARRVFPVSVDNRLLALCGIFDIFPRWMLDGRHVQTEMAVARLGPVTLITVPGEALPEVGFALQEKVGGQAWVLNLANDELGYLLSPRAWRDDTYVYERAMSVGPTIVPQLEQHLADLLAETS